MDVVSRLRSEMQAGTPATHGALTYMVPAMESAAKNAGKRSLFGADKGAKAMEKFLDTFKQTIYALYDDELVSTDDEPIAVLGALSHQLQRFSKAYPNWPEAYTFAQFFFSPANSQVHMQLVHETREFRRYLDAPRINYGSGSKSAEVERWWETDPRIKKVIDARKK